MSEIVISIHAPHARSDPPKSSYQIFRNAISIHAPHARSDRHTRLARTARMTHFNPRSSCEERLSWLE